MILVVYGTRPEALKLQNSVREAKALGLPVHVHCTMQSPQLVDKAILPWDSSGDYHALHFVKDIDFVVVVGDTRTVHETAWLAFDLGIPIFYCESGVRTYDLTAPYPEEAYRQSVARLAKWHACNTRFNLANLSRERISEKLWGVEFGPGGSQYFIYEDPQYHRVTGSPVVESVRERLASHDLSGKTLSERVVVTLHRRENRGHFANILQGIRDVTVGTEVIWYTHPNGWAADCATAQTRGWMRTPANPRDFALALASASCVVTDSGGVQEECNALGVPCVVARTVTDRPESLGKGGAVLGGNTRESIAQAIREALTIDRSTIDTTIFGDGTASKQVAQWWQEILSRPATP